ncbi:MAG: helix-turn-helix transcriptional regulator [Acidobacteria bacterium]|nr:helix-turn-helix transcriptional regulator [Acidobacteriota bacterium]
MTGEHERGERTGTLGPQATFERRVLGALEASPSRIPVVLGGCGTGRTAMLRRLRDRLGPGAVQYVDVEHCATTPERFLEAVVASSPFRSAERSYTASNARTAFEQFLTYLDATRAPGGEPATFLLDEALDLKTFESFPGLRHVLRDLVRALAASPNRFVLSTRYATRARWLLRDAGPRFEVMQVPPLSAIEVADVLAPAMNGYEQVATEDRDFLARAVLAITDGRPAYVKAVGEALGTQRGRTADPVSALVQQMVTGGAIDRLCRFSYELRLQRARGYGALKAILDILATEEPLTLTEISQRLHRTPGSTKDYLSWLEDVDLITSVHKRYSFTDPVLRLWVRVHCRPVPPTEEQVAEDVQRFALGKLPRTDTAPTLAYVGADATAEERRSWGIIEID